jgi:hypothetical protein
MREGVARDSERTSVQFLPPFQGNDEVVFPSGFAKTPPCLRFRKKSTAPVNNATQREAESRDASGKLTSTLDEREQV